MSKEESGSDVSSADLVRDKLVPTGDGDVKVHTIRLDGLFKCLALVKDAGLSLPPESLTLSWIVEQSLAADGTSDLEKAQEIFAKNVGARTSAIMSWIFTVPELATTLLVAVTDKTEEQVKEIALPDAVLILAQALALLDIQTTMGLAKSFFTDLGGLMDGLKSLQPKAPKADEQPTQESKE